MLARHFYPGTSTASKLTQFHNQLDAVDNPTPRDRIGRGKVSPMTTHAVGPHVEAKNAIERQMKAIIADVAEVLLLSTALPIIATRN